VPSGRLATPVHQSARVLVFPKLLLNSEAPSATSAARGHSSGRPRRQAGQPASLCRAIPDAARDSEGIERRQPSAFWPASKSSPHRRADEFRFAAYSGSIPVKKSRLPSVNRLRINTERLRGVGSWMPSSCNRRSALVARELPRLPFPDDATSRIYRAVRFISGHGVVGMVAGGALGPPAPSGDCKNLHPAFRHRPSRRYLCGGVQTGNLLSDGNASHCSPRSEIHRARRCGTRFEAGQKAARLATLNALAVASSIGIARQS